MKTIQPIRNVKLYYSPRWPYLVAPSTWLLLISLLFSCNTDDTPPPAEATPKVTKIIWSEKDFRQYTYLPDGKLSKYLSQWVYIDDNSGTTRQVTADFSYTSSSLLDKVVFDSGFFNKYYYEGSIPKKMEEYDNKNRLRLSHTYTFGAGGKLKESLSQVHDLVEGEANQIKQTYTYDNLGNLTEHKIYNKLQEQTEFSLSSITRYEEYDNKKSVDNLTYEFPYLPEIRFYTNNPGRRTIFGPNGSTVINAFLYTYAYNDKGYPVQKSVLLQTSPEIIPITASYQYE
jgi:YD repeat-containing protein